ncbi:hypothetical protein E2C01_059807 [Portunus trituberculatus]|uniref:HTH psq-type domain-containing protein n=1 Tax=Portunus trituberculatus TaxID=210409 RepID=A0A5B7H785_PORTR|nr:hypothetical protein [Portunus trituberculatus]
MAHGDAIVSIALPPSGNLWSVVCTSHPRPPPAIQTPGVRGQGCLLGVVTWIPFIMFPTAIGKVQEVEKGENGSKGKQSVKKPRSEKRDYRKGKKLNKYTAEDKDKVLQLLEKGHRVSEIQKLTGVLQSTISTLKSKKDEVKK